MKNNLLKKLLLPAIAVVVGVGCSSSKTEAPPVVDRAVNTLLLSAEVKKDPAGNVIEMNLTKRPIGNGDLIDIAQHPNLQRLWLTETGITDAGLADLGALQQLRVIGLAKTGITDAGLRHLARIRSLREVWIYPTRVSDSAVTELKTALPGVRVIY